MFVRTWWRTQFVAVVSVVNVAAMALTGWKTVSTWSTCLDADTGRTSPTTVTPAAYRHVCRVLLDRVFGRQKKSH